MLYMAWRIGGGSAGLLALALTAGATALGCAADASLQEEPGGKQQQTPNKTPSELEGYAQANAAPGYVPFEYPPAPYGLTKGSVIENLTFLGWSQPAAVAYNLQSTAPLQLADFYDPRGEKGIELLLINAVAVWCGVCRNEYADLLSNDLYAQLKPRGVEMLGLLFEDNNGEPARYADLVNWGSNYSVAFPFALDPAFKTGVYFDRSATPMNMLVDARTMEVLEVITGYNPALYQQVDAILTARGR